MMGKKTKKSCAKNYQLEISDNGPDIPINNLPNNVLKMKVKSGTKIRNVLNYAISHFPKHSGVVWTGIGLGVVKTISCSELFKRKHQGLHQITNLRYTEQKLVKDKEEGTRKVPEIFIALLRDVQDKSVNGYQAPGEGSWNMGEDIAVKKNGIDQEKNVSHIDAEEFASMGLRTGQKMSRKEKQMSPQKKMKTKKL
ncbi:ribonuclease P protein subunit p25-like protein isoform X2 [Prorops nasuta]|uniref:ribonuclease P protein subunit p25-like protein isoform X2 n=1 Tax=Prorops nasuta TaxID=863751 RepID=UPI0034CF39B9